MTDETVSPLRRRMIEDMTIRGFTAKTQHDYIRHVRSFAAFFGRSPHKAGTEDLRRYHLHLASSGIAGPSMNSAVSALRFFFKVTLGRRDVTELMPFVREPQRLPEVLIPDEVAELHPPTHAAPHVQPAENRLRHAGSQRPPSLAVAPSAPRRPRRDGQIPIDRARHTTDGAPSRGFLH